MIIKKILIIIISYYISYYLVIDSKHYDINYFDIVFNLFTSFGYFRTQREHNNAIRSITQGIKQNGILVIDYLNTHFEENNFTSSIEKEIDNSSY